MHKGAAFDLQAVCAGFVYGVSVADSMIKNGLAGTAMVIGAISLIILAVALFAIYGRHLAGRWRATAASSARTCSSGPRSRFPPRKRQRNEPEPTSAGERGSRLRQGVAR